MRDGRGRPSPCPTFSLNYFVAFLVHSTALKTLRLFSLPPNQLLVVSTVLVILLRSDLLLQN